MKKRYVYQITCQSSCYKTTYYLGFYETDLLKYFNAFKSDVKRGDIIARFTDKVFSSESKAKDFVSMNDTSKASLFDFVGSRSVTFEKYGYKKVEVL